MRFFSTAEKLSLGDMPFIVATEKPSRRDALAYYRGVVQHFGISIRQYERVTAIDRTDAGFVVHSDSRSRGSMSTQARAVVVATGYFGSPNYLHVPGEDLPPQARAYVDRLQELIETRITYVSVGTRRDQIIGL